MTTRYVAFGQASPLVVRETESPPLFVVGGDVGYRIGLVFQRVEMLLQFGQRDGLVDRHRIADDVQVVLPEIDDPVALRVKDVGVADVPFLGTVQSKTRCPTGPRGSSEGCAAG